jgi:hypothetical protein
MSSFLSAAKLAESMAASGDRLMGPPPARPGEPEAPSFRCVSQGQHESTDLGHGQRDELNDAVV